MDRIRRRALSATSNAAAFTPIAPKAPPPTSAEYDPYLASLASRILYRSGLDPSGSGGPLFILCAAAFPDTKYVDYNKLLPYVLSILPADEELLEDKGYSVIFFAGGSGDRGTGDYTYGAPAETAAGGKINRPAWSWSLQAYNLVGLPCGCVYWEGSDRNYYYYYYSLGERSGRRSKSYGLCTSGLGYGSFSRWHKPLSRRNSRRKSFTVLSSIPP